MHPKLASCRPPQRQGRSCFPPAVSFSLLPADDSEFEPDSGSDAKSGTDIGAFNLPSPLCLWLPSSSTYLALSQTISLASQSLPHLALSLHLQV